jgi:flavin-binding protein dodecin
MAGSTYKIIEIVGTSDNSWEDAVRNAIETADVNLRDMRISEITKLDVTIKDGEVKSYRVRLTVSFKYHKLIKKIKTQERPEDLFSDRVES